MTFSKHFFGKSLKKVTIPDLKKLIVTDKTPESDILEYKSQIKNFSEYSEDIVAFLNVSGGLLILGTPKEEYVNPNDKKRGKICKGGFVFHKFMPKDQLRNQLLGSIEPLPTGVEIHTVKDGGDENKCVTVIDIPKSQYPPHQSRGAYYVRLDGETRKAPHGIVEALFRYRKGPLLQLKVKLLPSKSLLICLWNNGTSIAKNFCLFLNKPPNSTFSGEEPDGNTRSRMVREEGIPDVKDTPYRFNFTKDEVIHPYNYLRVCVLFGAQAYKEVSDGKYTIKYKIFAEDMSPVGEEYTFVIKDSQINIIKEI